MLLPESLQSLINALERLPGIGPKSASRLAFYFLRAPEEVSQDLASALSNLKANTTLCQECFNITEAGRERCEICESVQRDAGLVCVVEEALDVLALERTGGYRGKYHVLQGVLSPIEGIGPDDLKIKQLIARVTAKAWRFEGEMKEIASTFGEAGLPEGFHLAAAEIYHRMANFKNAGETPPLDDVLKTLLA